MNLINSNIFKNLSFLFSQNILRMIVGLFVGIWLARYLGRESYGVFNFVLSFLFIFQPIINFGLNETIVRRIKQGELSENVILGSASYIQLFSTIISWILMIIVSVFMSLPEEINIFIFLYSLSTALSPLNNIESFLYSKLRLGKLVFCRSGIFLIIALLKIIFILMGMTLFSFICLSSIEMIFIVLVNLYVYKKEKLSVRDWIVDKDLSLSMAKESFSLVIDNFVMKGLSKIDQFFIVQMTSFTTLGLYAASAKLIEVWAFLPTIIANVYFSKILDQKDNEQQIIQFFSLLFWSSFTLALGCFVLNEYIIKFVYGDQFLGAEIFLKWYAIQFMFSFYSAGKLKYFSSLLKNHLNVVSSLCVLCVNILLNLVLIKKFGAIGAIYASILAHFLVNLVFHFSVKEFSQMNRFYLKSIIYPLYRIRL